MKEGRRIIRLEQNFVRKVVKGRFGKTLYNLETLEEYEGALLAGGRNLGPWLLFRWHSKGCLTRKILRAILIGVWNGAELPEDQLGPKQWIAFFRQAGYLTDCNKPRPTAPLQILSRLFSANGEAYVMDHASRNCALLCGVSSGALRSARGLRLFCQSRSCRSACDQLSRAPGEDEVIVDPSFLSSIQIESK